MYDDGGNVIYVDDRLFGRNLKKPFFAQQGNSRLVLPTNKRVTSSCRGDNRRYWSDWYELNVKENPWGLLETNATID